MPATLASVCTCGAVTVGTIHEKLMNLHRKQMLGRRLYNDEFFVLRGATGKRYFPVPDLEPNNNLGMFHQSVPFRRSITTEFMPTDPELIEHATEIAKLFRADDVFKLADEAPLVINMVMSPELFVARSGSSFWARCLDCKFSIVGRGSSNLGSWHACGTRHRVAYNGNRAAPYDITLVPVPVRRTITYAKNWRQQMRMPCDIDPYKHPVFKYGRTPPEVREAYKKWMRKYTPKDSQFPLRPWVDPYEEQYKKELDVGTV